MKFTIANPVYTVVGSCDDKDPATGPAQSYGPENQAADAKADGNSAADSTCLAATKLKVNAIAQTAHSTASAVANAKAMATSSLIVSYSWFDRVFAGLGWFRPELAMQVAVRLHLDVNDGPCGAGFTVSINNGPGGGRPVPSWQGLYAVARKPGDPTKLDVTRPNGIVETIPNPGVLNDWPDGPTITVFDGQYDLTFEINAVASADGRVAVLLASELIFHTP
jgi:hypothetical protein